eukprot:UN20222
MKKKLTLNSAKIKKIRGEPINILGYDFLKSDKNCFLLSRSHVYVSCDVLSIAKVAYTLRNILHMHSMRT